MEENNTFNEEPEIIELEADDGTKIPMLIDRFFFYNGEEYVVLMETGKEEVEDVGCLIMKVVVETENGEEYESFVQIEDEELEEKLFEVATTQYREDDDIEE